MTSLDPIPRYRHDSIMPNPLMRELDDDLVRLLKEQARRNHRSVEAEHLVILATSDEAAALRDVTRGRGGEPASVLIRRVRNVRSER